MSYARVLLVLRTSRGLSKRRLAILAGIHPSYVRHLEMGKKMPTLPMLERFAVVLGVPVWMIVLLASPRQLPERTE